MDPNFFPNTPDYYSPPPPSPPPPLPAPPLPPSSAAAPQPSAAAMNSPSPSPPPLPELQQFHSLDHTFQHLQAFINSNTYTFWVPSYGDLMWSEPDSVQEYLDPDLANSTDDFVAEEATSWLSVDAPPSPAAGGIRNPSESHDDDPYLANENYAGSSTEFDYHNHGANPGGLAAADDTWVSQSMSIIDTTAGGASINVDVSNAGLSTTSQRSHDEQEARHDRQAICIRVRSDQLILNDGYFWRKYGEKRIKNKEFTRSYFKCAESGCNVVKHVERCSENRDFVIVTYIGRHNHQCHA